MNRIIQQLLQQCGLVSNESITVTTCHGGQINQAFHAQAAGQDLFIKLQRSDDEGFFREEARALIELSKHGGLSCPRVLGQGQVGDYQGLVLSWIELTTLSAGGYFLAGQQLARCHQVTQETFGWYADNLIGTTRQCNARSADWGSFFIEQRLTPLIRQLDAPFLADNLTDLSVFTHSLRDTQPVASLLHGDLWSGNLAGDQQGHPVYFDPASYYGDRETDLALTELFGGFPSSFYQGYDSVWPLEAGYKLRRPWYQLYHILNHALIFGGGYLPDAQQRLKRLVNDH